MACEREALLIVAARIRRAKAREPVTLVRSPTLTKRELSPMFNGSEA